MKVRLVLESKTSGGESCPTPVVWLQVRDRYDTFASLKFRVDTQADVTTLPISLAQKEAVPFTKTRPGTARGIAGKIAKYRDRIRVVIAGREHDWRSWMSTPSRWTAAISSSRESDRFDAGCGSNCTSSGCCAGWFIRRTNRCDGPGIDALI
jgi:hypothetical protein